MGAKAKIRMAHDRHANTWSVWIESHGLALANRSGMSWPEATERVIELEELGYNYENEE